MATQINRWIAGDNTEYATEAEADAHDQRLARRLEIIDWAEEYARRKRRSMRTATMIAQAIIELEESQVESSHD